VVHHVAGDVSVSSFRWRRCRRCCRPSAT
jgi:hypothetical protein